ncbi:ArsR/SmtB family transcription factor [Arthrobacter sp. SO3]|uniref:ArsR/SmtB family transcription factor n=1 Tax=Arthrobacter sp. SO3 TaxID=1897057 RepID=UPI001CFF8296|nr:metalloregulator ArsR/SmtB family transcription factor [Arthrobacter sp. SO3]MCB5291902.1 HTH-type transcriptional regulator KmtR [Arthrobacter sp. SO3]
MKDAQRIPVPSLHHPEAPDSRRLEAATATFRMLSDPTRLHLLWLLALEPSDVGTLVEQTGASRTSVSQHLAKLRFSGLVTTQKHSRHVIYSLTDGHLTRLVMEGLNHNDHEVTGEPSHD